MDRAGSDDRTGSMPAAAPFPYDPALRRDTPLAREFARRIRQGGPIATNDYMDACLNDPAHGYYRRHVAIGRDGDFTTAPEISQVFGELIGLWCAIVWRQMAEPASVQIVELGAGRGTLLADVVRVAGVVPGFRHALSIAIVDLNPVLIAEQKRRLAECGVPVTWHERLGTIATDTATIMIANEFLDTIPAEQFVHVDGVWLRRAVALDDAGTLDFSLLPLARAETIPVGAGGFCECQDFRALAVSLQARAAIQPLAALFIDYGGVGGGADTMQAVRGHRAEHVLTSPGEADISVQVDFGRLVEAMGGGRALAVDGPITQGAFLGRLGAVERARRLMASNPSRANAVETGVARLITPEGMGARFKAIGVRSANLPSLPGFG